MRTPVNYLPAEHLRDYILSYGILTIPEAVSEPYFSPPIGLSGFIIYTINSSQKIVAKIGEKDHFTEEAVVTGQVTQPVHGQHVGKSRILLVFFHPMGIHQLFGTDMATLTNTSMSLRKLVGEKRVDELVKNLMMYQEDEHQIKVLDDFFSQQPVIKNDLLDDFRKMLNIIHANEGVINIAELKKSALYNNRKTLERHFRKVVGISPKVYCQIYQFKCLINFLQAHPGITWAQLANQSGYYDQSHMSRYIREYLNVSPNSIVNLDMDLINYLLSR